MQPAPHSCTLEMLQAWRDGGTERSEMIKEYVANAMGYAKCTVEMILRGSMTEHEPDHVAEHGQSLAYHGTTLNALASIMNAGLFPGGGEGGQKCRLCNHFSFGPRATQ